MAHKPNVPITGHNTKQDSTNKVIKINFNQEIFRNIIPAKILELPKLVLQAQINISESNLNMLIKNKMSKGKYFKISNKDKINKGKFNFILLTNSMIS